MNSKTTSPSLPKNSLADTMIRVNHAGEFSAKYIYEGQLATLQDPQTLSLVAHMAEQESRHLEQFSKLVEEKSLSPTKFLPLWAKLSYGLGVLSGTLGPQAAMACTSIVEEVIETHYQNQLTHLRSIHPTHEQDLQNLITSCLEDEQEHHALSLDHNPYDLIGFSFLKKILQTSLKVAIHLSERS